MKKDKGNLTSATNFISWQKRGSEYLDAAEQLASQWDYQRLILPYYEPIILLLGMSLEQTLKGFLAIAGKAPDEIVGPGHNLEELRKEAIRSGGLNATNSDDELLLFEFVNALYKTPYVARYPSVPSTYPLQDVRRLFDWARRISRQLDGLGRRQDLSDPNTHRQLRAGQ